MPTGLYMNRVLVLDRPAGEDFKTEPEIEVYRAGPFLEVEINGAPVGKVMKITECHCTDTMGDCSGWCIKTPHCVIVLTEAERDACASGLTERQELRDRKRLEDEFHRNSGLAYRSDSMKLMAKKEAKAASAPVVYELGTKEYAAQTRAEMIAAGVDPD